MANIKYTTTSTGVAMDQALNSQKTPHIYGMSFVSILKKNDRVIKRFYCILSTHIYYCVCKKVYCNKYYNRGSISLKGFLSPFARCVQTNVPSYFLSL